MSGSHQTTHPPQTRIRKNLYNPKIPTLRSPKILIRRNPKILIRRSLQKLTARLWNLKTSSAMSKTAGTGRILPCFPVTPAAAMYIWKPDGVKFSSTVPSDGTYTITLVSNADSYKENWLYLDDTSAGTLLTQGNQWNEHTAEYTLSAGTHKFGVSSSWGYTALDYVRITSDSASATDPSEPTQPEDPDPSEPSPDGGMYVSGGKLFDASGKEFIMRGINVAHAWYTDYTETSINAIADLGANCVRVVLADGTQWTKPHIRKLKTSSAGARTGDSSASWKYTTTPDTMMCRV